LAKLLVTTPSSHRRVLGCLDDHSSRLYLAKVTELRAHGIEVAEYDEPGLETVDGVADVGFALSAWFVDPGGNTIGLLQFKDKGLGCSREGRRAIPTSYGGESSHLSIEPARCSTPVHSITTPAVDRCGRHAW
jgi:hypothetical protein